MAATRKAPARTKAIRALKQYNAKRNFDRTPEPRGESASGSALSAGQEASATASTRRPSLAIAATYDTCDGPRAFGTFLVRGDDR